MKKQKLKSIAEARGRKKFDWLKFLKKRTYTFKELDRASYLSGSWITCACGNQCEIIPRGFGDEPIDSQLSRLGNKFHDLIRKMEYYYKYNKEKFKKAKAGAKETLKKIEQRSAILIKKELKAIEKAN